MLDPDPHLAGYVGLMQADAYAGFSRLHEVNRKDGPIDEAACWARGRRKFFDSRVAHPKRRSRPRRSSASMSYSPERYINGLVPRERLGMRPGAKPFARPGSRAIVIFSPFAWILVLELHEKGAFQYRDNRQVEAKGLRSQL